MTGKKNRLAMLLLAIAFIVSCVSAQQLSVSVNPKNPGLEVLELYPDEMGELEIRVINSGAETAKKITIIASVDNTSLVIMKGAAQYTVLGETIEFLEPGQVKSIFIMVKPKEFSKEGQPVVVNYGGETITHTIATYISIAESPLDVQARLAKSALDKAEGSKVVVTMRNNSKLPISNVSAELVLPSGLESKSPKVELDLLSSGESLVDREFEFETSPIVLGRQRLVLFVSFEDSKGRHILERDLFVDVQDRGLVLQFIIVAIIALVIIALYLKRNPSREEKPLGQPELKQVEGGKVKTLPDKSKEILK